MDEPGLASRAASGSSPHSSGLLLPLRGTGATVSVRQSHTLSSPTSASLPRASIESFPDSLESEGDDDFLAHASASQQSLASPQSSPRHKKTRSGQFDMRISLTPAVSGEKETTTWMDRRAGPANEQLWPPANLSHTQEAQERSLLEAPFMRSNRSSRTVTPSEAQQGDATTVQNHQRPLEPDEMHITLPKQNSQNSVSSLPYMSQGDSQWSLSDASGESAQGGPDSPLSPVSRLGRTAATHPSSQPRLQPALALSSDVHGLPSWTSTLDGLSASLTLPESSPTRTRFPRRAGDTPTSPETFRGLAPLSHVAASSTTKGSSAFLRKEPALPLDLLSFADTNTLFGEFDFGDFDSGLADSLGAGLNLGGNLESSARASNEASSSDQQSTGRSESPVVNSLSDSPYSNAQGSPSGKKISLESRSMSIRRSSRSGTPSVPISPSTTSRISTHPKASLDVTRSRADSDMSAHVHLSPEIESGRQRKGQSPTQTFDSVIASIRGHMRKFSGSDDVQSVASEIDSSSGPHTPARPPGLSHTSLVRNIVSSSSVRQVMSPSSEDHAAKSSSAASVYTPPQRRDSQRSHQNSLASRAGSPQVFRMDSPGPSMSNSTTSATLNKSLPPTPGRHTSSSTTFIPAESVPPMPAAPGVDNFGTLRKNAAMALRKSKGLLRSKKPEPLRTSGQSTTQRQSSDLDASSSVEIPISVAAGADSSPSYSTGSLPRGARSGSQGSLVLPRQSSESKRSASLAIESGGSAPAPLPRKVELLRQNTAIVTSMTSSAPLYATGLATLATNPARTLVDQAPEPRAIPRQPTTAELLDAAAAKLQALVQAAHTASMSGGSSRESFPPDAAALSSPASVRSSASSPPPEEHVTLGKAVRVHPGAIAIESPESPKVVIVPTRGVQSSRKMALENGPQEYASRIDRSNVVEKPFPPRSVSKQANVSLIQPRVLLAPATQESSKGPFWIKRRIVFTTQGATSPVLPPKWVDVDLASTEYRTMLAEGSTDRTSRVTQVLLPLLRRAEAGGEPLMAPGLVARRQRKILFEWLDILINELKDAPANRGVCLEGVAAIIESRFFCDEALQADVQDELRYKETLVAILAFAVDRLNEKAVYANTLAFSGRMLALAFFRIDGVAIKLLRLLPQVKRMEVRRLIEEAGLDPHHLSSPPEGIFPQHLSRLCYNDLQSYCVILSPAAPDDKAYLVATASHRVTLSGNWLIRWCASDSDLPFAFYRAYHRQLVSYCETPELQDDNLEAFAPIAEALTAPGYLFLAASLLEKAESLVHRNMRSVTTLGPNSGSFNTLDSATLSTGAKPKVLEMANRRVVSTMLDIVGGPAMRKLSSSSTEGVPEGLARRRLFGGVLQLWLRCIVKRTSIFDPRGIFLLLDFLESLFFATCTPPPLPAGEREPYRPSVDALVLLDPHFVLSVVQTILSKADNTVVLMRSIAFLYALFDILVLRHADRVQLCDEMLLTADIFERLFLFWNTSVRGYFQRLVVWRLSRLGQTSDGRPPSTKDPWIFSTLQTLNLRLEAIRKRHNELDPLDDLPDDDLFDDRRVSVSSTRGVTNQPWAVEELRYSAGRRLSHVDDLPPLPPVDMYGQPENRRESPEWRQASLPDAGLTSTGSSKAASKVVNWLKITLNPAMRKSAGRTPRGGQVLASRADPYALEISMPAEMVDPSRLSPLADEDTSIAYADFPHRVESESQEPSSLSGMVDTGAPSVDAESTSDDVYVQSQLGLPAHGPAFFKFEFETDAPRSDAFDVRKSVESRRKSAHSTRLNRDDDADSVYPAEGARSPLRRPLSGISPRVSKRFSKRASILPPPAFDLLFDTSEPVPTIPAHFRSHPPYEVRLHPYAVRGLREYEESLDELEIWLLRVKDETEELADRDMADLVPRLGVAWPISFDD